MERIEAKKGDLYSVEELQALAERGLEAVLKAGELRGELLEEFRRRDSQWNYSFDPETVYRSSRGVVGRILERVEAALLAKAEEAPEEAGAFRDALAERLEGLGGSAREIAERILRQLPS